MNAGSDQNAGPQRRIYSVTELATLLRHTLEDEFEQQWVEGEVSDLRRPASGHIYFTLKDDRSVLRSAFFRGAQRSCRVQLRDGLQVRVQARLSLYPARGDLQLIVQRLEEAGRGSLQEAFEKLKKRLAEEGLFDRKHKRPLPVLPRTVGIVTSRSGAALRDMLNVMGRRFPNLHVVLSPAAVQGGGAAAELVAALQRLNRLPGIDVIIIGRGGGSLEDLWPFNEETVARAVAASAVPVISAVGHETDWTICDLAADLRAPTPSAAAELVVGRKQAFAEQLRQTARRLELACRHAVLRRRQRLTAAAGSYVFHEPRHAIRLFRQRLAGLGDRLSHGAGRILRSAQQRLDDCNTDTRRTMEQRLSADRLRLSQITARLRYSAGREIQRCRGRLQEAAMKLRHPLEMQRSAGRLRLASLESRLKSLDPRAVLQRGYSITRDAEGRLLRHPGQAAEGSEIETELAEGRLFSRVSGRRTAENRQKGNRQ